MDLPGDVLTRKVDSKIEFGPLLKPAIYYPDPEEITKAVKTIKAAQSPLIIVGKGAAYSRAEK